MMALQRLLFRLSLRSLISFKPLGSIFNLSTHTPRPCSFNVDCITSNSPHLFCSCVPYSTTFSSPGMPLYQNSISKDVVVPLHPLQHQTLPLSNLDLTIPAVSFHIFFCYKNPSKRSSSVIRTIAAQVTMFSCRGIVVGCTFDHRIADAYSAVMFLKCWAKISINESIESLQPSFTRSILCPRDPPTYSSEIEKLYVKKPTLPSQESCEETPRASRIYSLDARQGGNLEISASENGMKRTKYEAFSAYVWKLLMHTKGVEDTMMSRLGILVDGRSRLMNTGVTPNYFGNVLLAPFAEANAGHIERESLSWAAKLVNNAICSAVDVENFQSAIDLVETVRPVSLWPSIYYKGDDMGPTAPSVMTSSGLRFGFKEVDYGWGKPNFVSLHFPLSGDTGYVMPMMSPSEDGSWMVYMQLPQHHIDAIESSSESVFRPIITKPFLRL